MTLPLLVVPGNDDPASLPQAVWIQVAVPLLWAVWLATRGPHALLVRPPFLWPLGLFLAWSFASAFRAADAFQSAQLLLRWIAAAALAVLVANVVRTATQRRRLLAALFWSSVVVSIVGLFQHLGGWEGLPQAFPPGGTLSNKNVAAGFVVAMAPLGVLAFAIAASWARMIVAAVSLGTALAFVFHADCRGAQVSLIAQLLAAIWLIPRYGPAMIWTRARTSAFVAGLAAFALLALSVPTPAGPAVRIPGLRPDPLQEPDEDPSAGIARADRAATSVAFRLAVWKNTVNMVRSSPLLGVGLGGFEGQYPRFANTALDGIPIDRRVESAHNDYLQLAAEVGLLGVALLGWVTARYARAVASGLQGSRLRDRVLLPAQLLVIVGLLAQAAFFPTVNQPSHLAAMAAIAGLQIRSHVSAPATPEPRPEPRLSPLVWKLSLAAAVFASAMAIPWGLAQIRADRHLLAMAHAEVREDWSEVAREGLVARRINPGRVDSRFGTAAALLRLGRTTEAAEILEEVVAVQPNNANALGNLGIAYLVSGDTRRAVRCFERVLRLRPGDALAADTLRSLMARAPGGGRP